ncbi:peroxiredoxin [Pleionea sediminis]|uniref:peroxiredoxin n=1 Tax=Pleionea sediminis TaxID=2569479 RepID=UPI001184F159|nr:peroxiredoxin [Pleionea sediminis]
MIKEGDKLPAATFSLITKEGSSNPTTEELFSGKKVVLFAVPGAFTPTCSEAHLPGFVVNADKIKAKGVDTIICLSVNDSFVMKAWGEASNADDIMMLADGGGQFTKAIGLEMETGDFGGLRSQRYSMIVDDGVVSKLNVEQPKQFEASTAEVILQQLS